MKKLTFLAGLLFSVILSTAAFAETGEAASGGSYHIAYAAAFIMAVASGMGTFSQSRAATTALDGISRNPQAADKVQTPLILSLALMESLVIFALIIAFLLTGKI